MPRILPSEDDGCDANVGGSGLMDGVGVTVVTEVVSGVVALGAGVSSKGPGVRVTAVGVAWVTVLDGVGLGAPCSFGEPASQATRQAAKKTPTPRRHL
jgi:hypothetical protein